MSEDKAQEGQARSARDSENDREMWQAIVRQARSARDAVSAFFTEINAEFHRISWPKGKELVETTLVVLTFIVGLSVTVLVFDKVIEHALKLVLGA